MKTKADTLDVSALLNYMMPGSKGLNPQASYLGLMPQHHLYFIITWNFHKVENFPVISDYFHTFLCSVFSFAETRNSTSPIRNITDSALTPILMLPVTWLKTDTSAVPITEAPFPHMS